MKKIFFPILILIIVVARPAMAQDVQLGQDNIKFHSTEAINNGSTLSIINDFIIRGSNEIEWTQTASDKTVYNITGTTGSWENLNAPGEIEFNVTFGTRTGKVLLYRNSGGVLKLRIDMFRNSISMVPFEFVISSFEKLN